MNPINVSGNWMGRLLFVAPILFSLLNATSVRAEGSRELTANGGYRPFLEFRNTSISGIPFRTTIKVYAEAGERIDLASSAFRTNGADIIARPPTGPAVSCDATTTAGDGVIANRAAEVAGPSTTSAAADAYDPCTIPVTETGVWEIDFESPNPGGTNDPNPRPANSDWPAPNNNDPFVAAWDVTVRANDTSTVAIPGRAFSNSLALNASFTFAGGFTIQPVNSQAFVLTEDGYRYQVNLNGIEPAGFFFFANKKGFIDTTTGDALFQSVDLPGTAPFPFEDPTDIANDDSTHKIFFNSPAVGDFPNSDVPSASGDTWLRNTEEAVPTPSNLAFAGVEGTTGQAGTTPLGGNFTFDVPAGFEGSYTIVLDLNDDGDFQDQIDRVLIGTADPGSNTVFWDGLDGQGNAVPPGNVAYSAQISLNAGEVHFPFLDVEQMPNGITIANVDTGDRTIYYDDTSLCTDPSDTTTCPANAPTPPRALVGVDSSGGAHAFTNNFGNNRGIDTWAYVPSSPVVVQDVVVVREADLKIAKTADQTAVVAGTSITYTITVTNEGPSDILDASPASFTDTIPADVTDVTWTCAITTGAGTCGDPAGTGNNINTTLALNDDSTATFTVTGTVDLAASDPLVNSATVQRPNDVTDPVDDDGTSDTINRTETATISTTVSPPSSDLGIVKDDGQTTVTPGEEITYTITVTNNGPSTLTSLTVTDTVPATILTPTFTPSVGSYDSNTGAWTGITLAQGDSITLTVTGTVDAAATGNLTNTATVAPPSGIPDPNSDNNSSTDTNTLTPTADLGVTKTVDNPNPTVGDTISYTLTVTNNGPSNTTGVQVTEPLATGLTYVSDDSGGAYNSSTGVWAIGDLANGASATLTITAEVTSADPITNTANITGSSATDPNPDNNADDVTVPEQLSDLSLAKSVSDSNPTEGDTITYTLILTNNGPSTATNIEVTEQLASDLTYVSDDSDGAYDPDTGVWSVSELENGASKSIEIVATVETADPITNTASITGVDQSDPTPENNEDSVTVPTIPRIPSLQLIKRVTRVNGISFTDTVSLPDWPANFLRGRTDVEILPGDEVEYTIYFLSDGNQVAENVTICDPLQDAQQFILNAFNGRTPTDGGLAGNLGIALALNSATPTVYLSSANDSPDRGRFYPPGAIAPNACALPNVRGAVVVEVGALSPGEYGFIRFRVRID
ncbi:DUF7507 domain-containing protein [Phormidium sp. CCY1219]|uniref:DUF7507 domain-containing protein n=1 Tax=Phormidium sp. CCY1219 TaxID=2886104 RepID=UPI002D1E9D44|nr:hypothetical protein [Phormidium sp. CCY1219]MEB3827244.1 DUF11 domain-containing protein [Phormidium sp. CCY1219]